MDFLKNLHHLNWIPAATGLPKTVAAKRTRTFRISMALPNWTEYERVLNRAGIETWGGGIDPSTDEYCFLIKQRDYQKACFVLERMGMQH
jgi:hypothetical protein